MINAVNWEFFIVKLGSKFYLPINVCADATLNDLEQIVPWGFATCAVSVNAPLLWILGVSYQDMLTSWGISRISTGTSAVLLFFSSSLWSFPVNHISRCQVATIETSSSSAIDDKNMLAGHVLHWSQCFGLLLESCFWAIENVVYVPAFVFENGQLLSC